MADAAPDMRLVVRALREEPEFNRWAGPAPEEHPSDDVAAVKDLAARAQALRDRVPLDYKGIKGGGVLTYRGTF